MPLFSSLSTVHYRWMALLWSVGILAACSIPASSLSPIGPALGYDKAAHFGLFAIFGVLWMRALCPPETVSLDSRVWQGGRLLLLGGLFGIGTEVYQHVLPIRRLGDPFDALADGIGLVAGVSLYSLYVYRKSASSPDPE